MGQSCGCCCSWWRGKPEDQDEHHAALHAKLLDHEEPQVALALEERPSSLMEMPTPMEMPLQSDHISDVRDNDSSGIVLGSVTADACKSERSMGAEEDMAFSVSDVYHPSEQDEGQEPRYMQNSLVSQDSSNGDIGGDDSLQQQAAIAASPSHEWNLMQEESATQGASQDDQDAEEEEGEQGAEENQQEEDDAIAALATEPRTARIPSGLTDQSPMRDSYASARSFQQFGSEIFSDDDPMSPMFHDASIPEAHALLEEAMNEDAAWQAGSVPSSSADAISPPEQSNLQAASSGKPKRKGKRKQKR